MKAHAIAVLTSVYLFKITVRSCSDCRGGFIPSFGTYVLPTFSLEYIYIYIYTYIYIIAQFNTTFYYVITIKR